MAVTNWEIAGPTLVCAASGRPLNEDEEIYSALYDEENTFVRRDFSVEHWPPPDMSRVFSFWKTRVPRKDAPERNFVDDETVLDFFRRLEDKSEPHQQHFRYVLALFLMRRKLLRFREVRRGAGGMVLLVHDRLAGTDHEVPDPQLSEEEIRRVSDEVSSILRVRL